MSEVWCIVSDDDVAARTLAGALLEQHDQVAVITRDAAPYALLVNVYADAILPAEIRDTDLLSLTDALWSIEESFGPVDVIALVGDAERMRAAEHFFAERWPHAELAHVTSAPSVRSRYLPSHFAESPPSTMGE